MRLKQSRSSVKFGISIFFLFCLTGCASSQTDQAMKLVTLQDYAQDICAAASKSEYPQIFKDLKAIQSNPQARKLSNYQRINSLIEEVKPLIDGTSKYTAGLKFFCEDLKKYKQFEKIPSDNEKFEKWRLESKSQSFQNSNSSDGNPRRDPPSDYLRPLNKMYPHWMRDAAGPLTGTRSDFGIIEVLYNANSKCTIWIFSSYSNFERFNQVWGHTFQFNYPHSDKFGNTYATENSIYSTTCAMEYSDVYG